MLVCTRTTALGGHYETSTPKEIPASGRGRCRATDRVADRDASNLRPDRLIVVYAADTDTSMYGETR